MVTPESQAPLNRILERLFERPAHSFLDEDGPGTLSDWDSHAHLELLSQLEEAYGISFSVDEQLELDTVARLREALRQRGLKV